MSDKYTIDEIEAAFQRSVALAHSSDTFLSKEILVAELRNPKPKFSKGQVGYCGASKYYHRPMNEGEKACNSCRPLNQTEIGPGWIPREPVMKLRKWVEITDAEGIHNNPITAGEALDTFDAEVSDE